MALVDIYKKRLTNLENLMGNADSLLTDLETVKGEALSDPVAARKFQRQIEEITANVQKWEEDYTEVSDKISKLQGSNADSSVNSQLSRVESQLQLLHQKLDSSKQEILAQGQATQEQIQGAKQDIIGEVKLTRETLLKQYTDSQQKIVTQLLDRMDENQLKTLAAINGVLAQVSAPEAKEELSKITTALEKLQQEPSVPEQVKQEVAKAQKEIEEQKDENGVKAALKFALPIIPGILDVSTNSLNPADIEFNLNFGFGKANASVGEIFSTLKGVWSHFKKKTEPQPA